MFVRLWLCNQDYLKFTIPEKFHVDMNISWWTSWSHSSNHIFVFVKKNFKRFLKSVVFSIVIAYATSMKAIFIVEESRHSSVVKGFLCKLSTGQWSLVKDFSQDCKTSLAIVDLLHWENFPLVIFTLGQVIPLVFLSYHLCMICILCYFYFCTKLVFICINRIA